MNLLTTEIGQDHLHIRGEYLDSDEEINVGAGSPPHTWRIPYSNIDKVRLMRITSTYVENTRTLKVAELLMWDHLHIRGEYSK